MTNHFPELPDGAHIAQLTYFPYATQLSDPTGTQDVQLYTNLTLGQQIHGCQMYSIGFDTGLSNGVVSFDYSTFDQDAYEANLAAFLDAWCAYCVAVLGVTTEQAQASVTVTRQWCVELNQEVLGAAGASYIFYDTMAYPPAA